jgi:hypothetical protein
MASLNGTINSYAYITDASVAAGSSVTFTVDDASPFSVDDKILIICIQDGAGGNAGLYETPTITAISSNDITVDTLVNTYHSGSSGSNSPNAEVTQIVSFPTYENPSVSSGNTVTSSAWDTETGGIVAFEFTGILTVDGAIDVDGLGFVGGVGHNSGGRGGESYTGIRAGGDGGSTGKDGEDAGGAGGGGGVNTANQGGGAGYGTFGKGGKGRNHDGQDGATWVGGDGGGVGVPPAGAGGSGGANVGGSGGGGSDSGAGGGGGTYGFDQLATRMFFGSGGGGGLGTGNDGGKGGGIIFISGPTFTIDIDSGTGSITAEGVSGVSRFEGGGGSGGAIYLNCATVINQSNISVAGGIGRTTGSKGKGGEGRTDFANTQVQVVTRDANIVDTFKVDNTGDVSIGSATLSVPETFSVFDGLIRLMDRIANIVETSPYFTSLPPLVINRVVNAVDTFLVWFILLVVSPTDTLNVSEDSLTPQADLVISANTVNVGEDAETYTGVFLDALETVHITEAFRYIFGEFDDFLSLVYIIESVIKKKWLYFR